MSIFEKEKNDYQELFKDYNVYATIKQNKNEENKNKYKRIFSLPWIIEDIRYHLLKLIHKKNCLI